MPVLREEDVVERCGECVNSGDDLVTTPDGERAAGEEVDLHVDDEEDVGGWEREHGHDHLRAETVAVRRDGLSGLDWARTGIGLRLCCPG